MNITRLARIERAIKLLQSLGIKVGPVDMKDVYERKVEVTKKDHNAFETWAKRCYPSQKFYVLWTTKGKLRFKKLETLETLKRTAAIMREHKRLRHQNGATAN